MTPYGFCFALGQDILGKGFSPQGAAGKCCPLTAAMMGLADKLCTIVVDVAYLSPYVFVGKVSFCPPHLLWGGWSGYTQAHKPLGEDRRAFRGVMKIGLLLWEI